MSEPKMNDESARKKAKTAHDLEEVAKQAFILFRNHLDLTDDDDQDLNMGQLVKLIESSPIEPFRKALSSVTCSHDFLGIVASLVYFQLASTAIETFLNQEDGSSEPSIPQDFIDKSLMYYSKNAACRSMGANFGRISETLSKTKITEWYQQAAQDAQQIRTETMELLETEYEDESIKEWMETLLLNHICGVEYVENDEQNAAAEDGYFSASSVEGTCCFMAATLLSRDGHHNDALSHLEKFDLTHRLHPNIWTGEQGSLQLQQGIQTTTPVYVENAVPKILYTEICRVFGPAASFWKESDYANRGYYSFLDDIDDRLRPKNLIDEVVVGHLLPFAEIYLRNHLRITDERICQYEWWVHCRQGSLGHMLHFDTDEANLKDARTVHHPVISSVLYLSGDETSGPTIVLNQTPNSSDDAEICWRSVPRENTFMMFPGNLLHGVLPCPGNTSPKQDSSNDTHSHWITDPSPSKRRITFMVGFKTRRVPDQRQGQCLYGPCAPLPEEGQAWVKDIKIGYNVPRVLQPCPVRMHLNELPQATPAWERINRKDRKDEPPLPLPRGIDNRFFVSDAPECFRKTLFENDDDE